MLLFIPGVPADMPWYLELGVAAGVLTSAGIIWNRAGLPAAKALVRAVKAAPEIVTGIEALTEIVQSDVVGRLEDAAQLVDDHGLRLDDHQRRLDGHDAQIAELAGRLRDE